MDWLRSEDLKEENGVIAPSSHYSSLFTLSFPSGPQRPRGVLLDMHRMNPEYLHADTSCRLGAAQVFLREEPDEEEDDEEEDQHDDKADNDEDESGYSE
jgi:hypothetical protein